VLKTQGATIDSKSVVVRGVRVLALQDVNVSLDVVLSLTQCFPRLQKLYIKVSDSLSVLVSAYIRVLSSILEH
jgi:hypothetical protein